MKVNFPLFALAIGAFGIGTTEFSPMGLLPIIAKGVDVSIPAAGMLVSAYAIGVMLGAPVMTLLLAKYSRRSALIFLMSIFTVGNLLSALSPNYTVLLLSRIITSLNHGAFFGLGAIVAANVVPVGKQSSAVSIMFMGLTLANIGGVPVATWLGDIIGWRASFLATSGLGVLAMMSLFLAIPNVSAGDKPNVKQELAVLIKPKVVLALLTTVLCSSAMFTLYTYIAPVLYNITSVTSDSLTLMLMLIGVGFSVGNYLGGKFSDRSIDGTLKVFLVLSIIIMLVIPFFVHSKIATGISMIIWGSAVFALVPPVQVRVMQVARKAPGLASSVNIGAFNLGNALGAMAGGAVISLGLGYQAVPLMGAAMAVLALVLVVINQKMLKD